MYVIKYTDADGNCKFVGKCSSATKLYLRADIEQAWVFSTEAAARKSGCYTAGMPRAWAIVPLGDADKPEPVPAPKAALSATDGLQHFTVYRRDQIGGTSVTGYSPVLATSEEDALAQAKSVAPFTANTEFRVARKGEPL